MPILQDPGLARLFADSREALKRYVRRLTGSSGAAEEIVQETFLRAYRQREAVDIRAPYLFSIARNLVFKARRHERVVDAFANGADNIPLQGLCELPEDAALADERLSLLHEAIQSLPPQCRAAFTLRMFQERSYQQIAAELGISARTVEKHIAAGAVRVHAALARKYQEAERS